MIPDRLQYFLEHFLDRPKHRLNLDPRARYLLPKHFKQSKKNMGTSWKILSLEIRDLKIEKWNLKVLCTVFFWTFRAFVFFSI